MVRKTDETQKVHACVIWTQDDFLRMQFETKPLTKKLSNLRHSLFKHRAIVMQERNVIAISQIVRGPEFVLYELIQLIDTISKKSLNRYCFFCHTWGICHISSNSNLMRVSKTFDKS